MDLTDLPRRLSELVDSPFTGVMVHGSYARGDFDHHSDIDVLLLLDSGLSWSSAIVDGDETFDIKALRVDLARMKMTEVHSDNNNTFLRAMFDGRIVHDPTQVLAQLQSEGKRLWNAGAPLPSPEERSQLRREVAVVLATAERAVLRDRSESQGLAWLLLHNSFTSIVSKYHRLKGFWRPSMTMLVAESAIYDPELSELCGRFLRAETPDMALTYLHRLEASCLNHDEHVLER